MQYRTYDGGQEEIYTYADHLADWGALRRGERDMVRHTTYARVNWRKAKRMVRHGWIMLDGTERGI